MLINQEKKDQMEKFIKTYHTVKLTSDALQLIVDEYEENKQNLGRLFNGKLIIEKEIETYAGIDSLIQEVDNHNLEYLIKEKIENELQKNANTNLCNIDPADRRFLLFRVFNAATIARNKVTSSHTFTSEPFKGIKIQEGAKVTKCLKKFISDKKIVDMIQTQISQIHNTSKLKGTLCISIDPIDYYTASLNVENWTSCYVPGGQYSASPLMLVNSPNTIVAYVKTSREIGIGEGEKAFNWNSKKWRTFITLNNDLEKVHLGKQYPYNSADFSAEVVRMIQELTGRKYSNHSCDHMEYSVEINAPQGVYNDTFNGAIDVFYTDYASPEVESILLTEGAICPNCGNFYDETEEGEVICHRCAPFKFCPECERYRDELAPVGDGSHLVCLDCTDNWIECKKCGHSTHEDDGNFAIKGGFYCTYCAEEE